MEKKESRLRRARRTRATIKQLGVHRLCVHRTPRHIYAQIVAPNGEQVVASASTVEAKLKAELKGTGNAAADRKIYRGARQSGGRQRGRVRSFRV